MLRKTFLPALAAVLAALAISSTAQAWGGYHYGYHYGGYGGGYHASYTHYGPVTGFQHGSVGGYRGYGGGGYHYGGYGGGGGYHYGGYHYGGYGGGGGYHYGYHARY